MQRDLGAAPQHSERRAQLVRRVGHEASHVLDRAFDGGCRLANEKPSASDDEQERRRRGPAERRDQGCITILELDLVGDGDGDHRRTAGEREALGVQTQRIAAMWILVAIGAADA